MIRLVVAWVFGVLAVLALAMCATYPLFDLIKPRRR